MRHASLVASDAKKIHASPRLPSRDFTAPHGIDASDSRTTLPTLGASASASGRGQSPNVAKRTGWTTPRAPNDSNHVTDGAAAEQGDLNEYADKVIQQQQRWPVAPNTRSAETSSMESAVEILEAIALERGSQSELVRHRSWLLQRTDALHSSEAKELESQQLAYLEHMHVTVELLQADLERARRRGNSNSADNNVDLDTAATAAIDGFHGHTLGSIATTTTTTLAKATKRSDGPAKLLQSPLRVRLAHGPTTAQANAHADLQSALERNVDARIRSRMLEKSALERERRERSEFPCESLVSTMREHKLRETLNEKLFWQHEYASMRDEVVKEKIRQVELFQRLERAKREHLVQTEELERALRECCVEIELLRAQLAETHVRAAHQTRAMEALAKGARDEKETLVCSIAETRHKFKEWKDGEAGTLKAARDQAVHNLKTEYELKIARHHDEKQKLRDKVKDLEVSLRLLQKDRHLSPAELSLRKATILGSKETNSTTEAELIEANCRIKELEALLNHAKEYQKRQEHIIRVSEATVGRLVHEREVVALENLTLQPMASLTTTTPLVLANTMGPTDSAALTDSLRAELLSPTSTPLMTTVSIANELGFGTALTATTPAMTVAKAASVASPRAFVVSPLPHTLAKSDSPTSKRRSGGQPPKYTSAVMESQAVAVSQDPEKEILRRQSIVLSAEVEKYRQIVVHSLDEIRALKDNRRRSHHGIMLAGQNGSTTTLKEQYLMGEVVKLQAELEAIKTAQKKQKRMLAKSGDAAAASDDESDSSNSNSSSSDSESEHDGDNDGDDDDDNGGIGVQTSSESGVTLAPHEAFDMKEGDDDEADNKEHDHKDDPSVPAHARSEQSVPALSTPPSFASTAMLTMLTSLDDTPPPPGDGSEDSGCVEQEQAIKVIQSKSKTFLLRRDFIKRKIAIGKIKARYRGYLVRKNVELLDRYHQKPFIVSAAMQYKMEIVQPHHEMTCKCHGLQLRLVIRVSKDPPVVQIQMTAAAASAAAVANRSDPLARFDTRLQDEFEGTRVTYLHLFEIIALLPHETESAVLETASEKEIAETLAPLLSVVRMGGQYRFAIKRRAENSSTDADPHDYVVQFSSFPSGGSVLSELPVERTPERVVSRGKVSDSDMASDARELEDLIRKARVPLADHAVHIDFSDVQTSGTSRADHVHLKKFLRRLSSSNFDRAESDAVRSKPVEDRS